MIKNKNSKKEYYERNREKRIQAATQWRIDNKEKTQLIKQKSAEKHREKYNETARLKRKLEKERYLNTILKYKYNITIYDYKTMLLAQNNKCAICSETDKLCVDHCHKTGKVRGLLCKKCNSGLGYFKDSIEFMSKAIEYLKEK